MKLLVYFFVKSSLEQFRESFKLSFRSSFSVFWRVTVDRKDQGYDSTEPIVVISQFNERIENIHSRLLICCGWGLRGALNVLQAYFVFSAKCLLTTLSIVNEREHLCL